MGEEADAKGGQPWRFDIRIVSLDDLPPDVEGVAVLWAKGEVRAANCTNASLRALTPTARSSLIRCASPLRSALLRPAAQCSTARPCSA